MGLLVGGDGQLFTFIAITGNTTIANNTTIETKSGSAVVIGNRKTIELIKLGSRWLEV